MYKLSNEIFYKIVNDSKVLLVELNTDNNVILQIEGVSCNVFLSVVKGEELDSIIDRISIEYQIAREQVTSDCEKFIKELIDKGILSEN